MPYKTIDYSLDRGIARITLNRPEVMNALNTRMRAEITDALRRAADEGRVVVLTGNGRAFCSGQDLGDRTNADEVDLEAVLRDEYEPMLRRIHECPVPVIAAVNGAAAGAGANLALSCDLVIAAHSARFLQAFARIGLIPDAGGTWWLPRQVGFARAMGLSLLAEPLDAATAAQWGLIWEAVPDEEFAGRWQEIARKLAEGPTMALGAIRTALRASLQNDLDSQLELEARLQGECGRSLDFREGVLAFREKRAPRFEGR